MECDDREYNLKGMENLRLGNSTQCIYYHFKALRIQPYEKMYWYNRGYAKFRIGLYKSAIADLLVALKIDPKYVNALITVGHIYSSSERNYEMALKYYSMAGEVKPNSSYVYSSRGSIYALRNEKVKAIADCNVALRYNPTNVSAVKTLGLIYLRCEHDYDRAKEYFLEGLELDCDRTYQSAFYAKIGECHTKKHDYDEAVMWIEKAVEVQTVPSEKIVLGTRCSLLYKMGKFDHALELAEKCIKICEARDKSGISTYLILRGKVLRKLGKIEESIKCCEQAIVVNKYASTAHFLLSKCYLNMKDLQAALKKLNETIDVNPHVYKYYRRRALTKYEIDKKDCTVEVDFAKAIELAPCRKTEKLVSEKENCQ